jgi:acyl carrier protein
MDNSQLDRMIQYVKTQVLRNPQADIGPDTPLVSSGMIDSFALIETLVELERVTDLRIPAAMVAPTDMDTVRKMFDVAARLGKPRKR